jgi:uncharacterized protein (TIGR02421 family)
MAHRSTESSDTVLLSELVEHIKGRLKRGGRVVRALPNGGRMMIDRPLPFICIHRSKDDEYEAGVDQILRAQTAYMRASSDPALASELRSLINAVTTPVADKMQAFLIIEIWAADPKENNDTFKVRGPLNNAPETAGELEKGLKSIAKRWRGSKVEMIDTDDRHPPYAQPLFELAHMKKAGILLLGIEIPQIYLSPNGEIAKMALRRLRDRFTDVIKRTVHAFVRVQTPQRYEHHLVLGRTRFTRLAMSIDKALARISASFDLLLNVSPVNNEEAWHEFQRCNHEKKPDLHYRLISVDPERIKRELYALRIDDMEDTTLQTIFRSKRAELDTQVTLLSERGRRDFLYSGLRLYGGVDDDILQRARLIMAEADRRIETGAPRMHAAEFMALVVEELSHYNSYFPALQLKVIMSDEIPGVMVSKGTVLIGERFAVEHSNAEALIHHEVGTHVLTYANGRMQPFEQLHAGMAGYEQFQEGLAVLAEYLSGGLGPSRYKLLGGRVVAVHALIQGADFVECFSKLHNECGFPARSAFNITVRVYRGGGLPKDAIYLKGLAQLIDHLDGQYDQMDLFYTGKFALQHLSLIKDLHHRGVLKVPVLPRYLTMKAKKKLAGLKKGMDLATLLDN